MRAINTEYYGDDVRWFMGEIKSINDPDKLGRVRVRIFGIHSELTSDIALTDLPWANVVLPVTQGGTSNTTQATGIQIGAKVFGVFVDGAHSQVPLVLGSVPHNPELRVKYDGAADPFVDKSNTSAKDMYKPGDRVSASTNIVLEENGQPTAIVGDTLTPDQIAVLNSVSTGSGILNISLVGSGRLEQAFNFLKEHFQQREHKNPGNLAAGFVGNFLHEGSSGGRLDPTIKGDGGNALGIAQWNGKAKGRYFDLVQYAKSKRAGEGNFGVQLSFVAHELSDRGKESWVWPYLMNANTIEQATEAVFTLYERPEVSGIFRDAHSPRQSYTKYQSTGGIDKVSKTGQSAAIKNYRSEYLERLSAAKSVYLKFGG